MKLSKEVENLLNGKDLAQKQSIVMMLQSVTKEGYPHTAMVSVGEIVAINSEHLRIALWPQTQTTMSLTKLGKASLVIVYNNKVIYLELNTKVLPEPDEEVYERIRFEAYIKSIKEDKAKYADIKSGITVKLHNSKEVLDRWQTTIKELLSI